MWLFFVNCLRNLQTVFHTIAVLVCTPTKREREKRDLVMVVIFAGVCHCLECVVPQLSSWVHLIY